MKDREKLLIKGTRKCLFCGGEIKTKKVFDWGEPYNPHLDRRLGLMRYAFALRLGYDYPISQKDLEKETGVAG